jgi:hypothetical protein
MNGDIRSYDARKSAQEFEEFTREFERQEQAKRDAALKPLTVVSAEAAREKRLHDFDMGCLWSAPIEDLKKIIDSQQWQRLYWELHFRGDSPRVNQSASAAMQAFAEYIASLTKRTGFKLNDDGVTRLLLLSKVEFFHGIETTQATLDVALDALLQQTAFAEGEVEYDEAWKATVTPVESKTTPKDLIPLYEGDLETRQQALNDEQQKVWQAFTDSVYANLRCMLNEEQKLYIYNLMRRRGYSFLDPREYDAARIQAVRDKVLPESFLYPQEALDMYIESHDINDPEVKHQILVRQRLINQERLNAMNIHGR